MTTTGKKKRTMTRTERILLAVAAAALGLGSFGLLAAGAAGGAQPGFAPAPAAARTVWLDVGIAGRRERAARRLTELHEAQAREGYRLVDVEPYFENQDLEGFWVSYVPDRLE